MTTMMAIPTKIRFNDEWRIDLAATGDGLVAQLPNGVRVSARAPKLANENPEGRFAMSVADDQPFEHWFTTRVSMKASAAIFDRVRNGIATVLYRHYEYVGRIEAVGIKDGVLWAEIELSPHIPLAQEILADIQDGRLRGVSLGANIYEAELVETDDGDYMLEILKWELVEASITPTPANGRVGIKAERLDELKAQLQAQKLEAEAQRQAATTESEPQPETKVPETVVAETPTSGQPVSVSVVVNNHPSAVQTEAVAAEEPGEETPESGEATEEPTEETQAEQSNQTVQEAEKMPESTVLESSAEAQKALETPQPGNHDYHSYVSEMSSLAVELNASQHLPTALQASVTPEQFKKLYGIQDTPANERVQPAQAKPNANWREFDLLTVVQAMEQKASPEAQERAAASFRCIEILRAATPPEMRYNPQAGGIMVPWELLMLDYQRERRAYEQQWHRAVARHQGKVFHEEDFQHLQAAVTTTTSAAGAIEEELRPEMFVEALLEENMFLGFCTVVTGLDRNIAIPTSTSGPEPVVQGEGAAARTAATFTMGQVATTPKNLSVYWAFTPEAEFTTENLVERFGMMEAMRRMADVTERQLFRGDGSTAGHVTGFEASIGSNSASYTNNAGPTVLQVRETIRAMNARVFPRSAMSGRLFAASPRMMKRLDTLAQVAGVSSLIENGMIFKNPPYPIIETTHMTESSAATDGRLLHISARDQLVAFYGTAAEVISFTHPDTHERQRGILQLWHSSPLRSGLVQRLMET